MFDAVNPQNLWELPRGVHDFPEELRSTVESTEFKKYIGSKERWKFATKIHRDKISKQVSNYLIPKGLAKPPDRADMDWYRFENNTARLYMSLLAKYLADIEGVKEVVPSTDIEAFHDLSYAKRSDSAGFTCAKILFRDVLPVPRNEVPIEDILNFKEDHRSELLSFRQLVDEFEQKLTTAQSESDLRNMTVRFREKIQLGVNNLAKGLEESRISTALGSLNALMKMNSPFFATAAISMLGSYFVNFPLEVTVGVTATVGAIQVGSYLVDQRNQRHAMIRESPFAYLHSIRSLT